MAEIFSPINVPGTGLMTYVGMYMPPARTLFELKGQSISPDGLSASADYVYVSGDPEYPVTANIRINIDPEKSGTVQQVHFSIRLRGNVKHVEDSTTPDTVMGVYPYDTVIAWNIPRPLLKDTGTVSLLIQQGFLMAYHPAQAAAPEDAQLLESNLLNELMFLSPTVLG